MPYLPTVPPEEAAGEVQEMYGKDLAAQGYVAARSSPCRHHPGAPACGNVLGSGVIP